VPTATLAVGTAKTTFWETRRARLVSRRPSRPALPRSRDPPMRLLQTRSAPTCKRARLPRIWRRGNRCRAPRGCRCGRQRSSTSEAWPPPTSAASSDLDGGSKIPATSGSTIEENFPEPADRAGHSRLRRIAANTQSASTRAQTCINAGCHGTSTRLAKRVVCADGRSACLAPRSNSGRRGWSRCCLKREAMVRGGEVVRAANSRGQAMAAGRDSRDRALPGATGESSRGSSGRD
jgi:hypothetical protein